MKVLLDHNLDKRLKRLLHDHEASTTYENGWSDAKNGELLSLAEESGFSILLTSDANLSKQQNLAGRNISVIVFRALDNRLTTHEAMMDEVLVAMAALGTGKFLEIFHPSFPQNG